MNWPKPDTGKPHMRWGGKRWYVQASGKTNSALFGKALQWSWAHYLAGRGL
jgi:hypothetical protein